MHKISNDVQSFTVPSEITHYWVTALGPAILRHLFLLISLYLEKVLHDRIIAFLLHLILIGDLGYYFLYKGESHRQIQLSILLSIYLVVSCMNYFLFPVFGFFVPDRVESQVC